MAVKYSKWLLNVPSAPILRPSKIWTFGLKKYHLATLLHTRKGKKSDFFPPQNGLLHFNLKSFGKRAKVGGGRDRRAAAAR
jgi:hypothetical protein